MSEKMDELKKDITAEHEISMQIIYGLYLVAAISIAALILFLKVVT